MSVSELDLRKQETWKDMRYPRLKASVGGSCGYLLVSLALNIVPYVQRTQFLWNEWIFEFMNYFCIQMYIFSKTIVSHVLCRR